MCRSFSEFMQHSLFRPVTFHPHESTLHVKRRLVKGHSTVAINCKLYLYVYNDESSLFSYLLLTSNHHHPRERQCQMVLVELPPSIITS